jgi:CheY-like chemotaxis protein
MKKLVLIVEDEYGNAEILQLLLEAHGYRVVSAPNGRLALERLADEKPALILSDFMMPYLNGAELGEAVRRDPALRDIPFVFMSATSVDVVQRSFKDYDAFVRKPYEVDALLVLLDKLIAQGRAAAQPSSAEVDESMRQLLKGIRVPPAT